VSVNLKKTRPLPLQPVSSSQRKNTQIQMKSAGRTKQGSQSFPILLISIPRCPANNNSLSTCQHLWCSFALPLLSWPPSLKLSGRTECACFGSTPPAVAAAVRKRSSRPTPRQLASAAVATTAAVPGPFPRCRKQPCPDSRGFASARRSRAWAAKTRDSRPLNWCGDPLVGTTLR